MKRLSMKETMLLYKRLIDQNAWRISMCGVTCNAGANGEPLACAYKRDHEGPHSWATLPTFPLSVQPTEKESKR